jgi:hypothetical protein
MEVPANTAQETPVLAVDGIMVICSDGQLYILYMQIWRFKKTDRFWKQKSIASRGSESIHDSFNEGGEIVYYNFEGDVLRIAAR